MRKAILFTNFYPYHKGEEYLENEIDILCSNFDKVYIFPTMVSNKMKLTRKVPSNAEIINLNLSISTMGKLKMFFGSNTNNLENISVEYTGNLIQKIYTRYFCSRVAFLLEKFLDTNICSCMKEDDEILLYSYWFHVTASLVARIKHIFLKKNIKILAISRAHRYDLYDYASPVNLIPDRNFVLKNIDYVFPCSQDGVDYLITKYPIFANKIVKSYLGTKELSEITCTRIPVFDIVSCSTTKKVKRIDKIINVLSYLQKNENFNFRWTHIGSGKKLNKIKKLASLKLEVKSFRFLGNLSNKEVNDYYSTNNVSLFINLSDSEGVSVAIMEAISRGIPVIATDVGGTREIVHSSVNGILVSKYSSIKEIAKSIIDIKKINNKEYEQLCYNSRDIWQKYFNSKKNYREFYELINDKIANLGE